MDGDFLLVCLLAMVGVDVREGGLQKKKKRERKKEEVRMNGKYKNVAFLYATYTAIIPCSQTPLWVQYTFAALCFLQLIRECLSLHVKYTNVWVWEGLDYFTLSSFGCCSSAILIPFDFYVSSFGRHKLHCLVVFVFRPTTLKSHQLDSFLSFVVVFRGKFMTQISVGSINFSSIRQKMRRQNLIVRQLV